MYVKRHAVRRGKRRYVYLRLVESYRDERGRVRHRVLRNLGREDELKASGQLNQLAASFARLDPPLAGIRREVGPLLLVAHLAHELGLVAEIDRLAPARRRSELSVGELVVALIANRLCAPAPLYDVAGWASGAAIQELFGIPPQLLDCHEEGPPLVKRSAVFTNPRSTKEARFICCTLDSISVARSSISACSPGRESTSTSSPSRRTSTR